MDKAQKYLEIKAQLEKYIWASKITGNAPHVLQTTSDQLYFLFEYIEELQKQNPQQIQIGGSGNIQSIK